MSDEEVAVWLVAGGEPGAQRFGQLVQRLRKERRMSVEDLARDADLAVGTIRAIEQGRRAPSKESGVRLLQQLLAEGELVMEPETGAGDHQLRADLALRDPESGTRVLVEFKAKAAGDNRRWSSDKAVASETTIEARIREIWADPERRADWLDKIREGVAIMTAIGARARGSAARPADDADFGNIVRKLATANEFRLQRLSNLLYVWDKADSDSTDEWALGIASSVNDLLDSFHLLTDEERATLSE